MKLFLGSDHAGYVFKEKIKQILDSKDIKYEDCGCFSDIKSSDYPDIAKKVSEKVVASRGRGILICGTGIGMSIAANKIKGVRAARILTAEDMILAIEHNDANIFALPGRQKVKDFNKIISLIQTKKSVAVRHKKRITQITTLEKNIKK